MVLLSLGDFFFCSAAGNAPKWIKEKLRLWGRVLVSGAVSSAKEPVVNTKNGGVLKCCGERAELWNNLDLFLRTAS